VIRVAQKTGLIARAFLGAPDVIVPVQVVQSTPKQMRGGAPQYVAHGPDAAYGGGDSIEEAVDAVSEQL
jgi:hypothetical protein